MVSLPAVALLRRSMHHSVLVADRDSLDVVSLLPIWQVGPAAIRFVAKQKSLTQLVVLGSNS